LWRKCFFICGTENQILPTIGNTIKTGPDFYPALFFVFPVRLT
jgi:hypothetical protein